MAMEFDGAKLALFVGDRLVVMRRDAKLGIPWPGALDWPGGGCEPGETPEETVLRETWEEVGLRLDPADLSPRRIEAPLGVRVVKFTARIGPARAEGLRLGDEGQALGLMTPAAYAAHPDAVPSLAGYLRETERISVAGHAARARRMWLRELVRRAGAGGIGEAALAEALAIVTGGAVTQEALRSALSVLETQGEVARSGGILFTGPRFLAAVTGDVPED